jgi:hypothetical protein
MPQKIWPRLLNKHICIHTIQRKTQQSKETENYRTYNQNILFSVMPGSGVRINIREALLTLSLINAVLLVRGFTPGFVADIH